LPRAAAPKAIENQHAKGRFTARERIALLADPGTDILRAGIVRRAWHVRGVGRRAGGGCDDRPGASAGRMVMIIVNDATVKAGAFFPMTAKKVIRAQNIAIENHIPTIYLVDSAGVFLPLQEDVFPDTDDFGRVFRNNAVMSAMGIPQIAAIMGMCVAGGAYLPVMCDHILMTEGSGLFLAGPALVQAAIGQKVFCRRTGRRQDAFADQRHCGLPRARRSVLPGAHSPAGGQDGEPAPARRLRSQEARATAVCGGRSLRHLRERSPRGSTT
jgi:3-methylcrotonyl-CoA carboxylase beta subunit